MAAQQAPPPQTPPAQQQPTFRSGIQTVAVPTSVFDQFGDVAVGMHKAGWDLQLTEYGNGWWRATFWVTGFAHSITGGSAYEATAWGAVQRAAWEAVNNGAAGNRR